MFDLVLHDLILYLGGDFSSGWEIEDLTSEFISPNDQLRSADQAFSANMRFADVFSQDLNQVQRDLRTLGVQSIT